ncbi:putative transcription factor C2H2 family [Dioscorea sansibarensis]
MSSRDSAAAAAVARFATACDGVFLGITLAYFAIHSWANYFSISSSLRRLRAASNPRVSDLRLLLNSDEGSAEGNLVVVRGSVQPKPAFDRGWTTSQLVSCSGERAVVVQRTQTCLYNEWTGLFGRRFDLHTLLFKSMKEQQSSSLRSIPFVLMESSNRSNSDYVSVNLDGSAHQLPLATVYHHLHPVQPSPYTFLQILFGQGYPIALLDEEKILPVGKEVTAIGICTTKGGAVEIKSCRDLPCFLSDMTKGEIEADMATRSGVHFWCGLLLGTMSVGVLGYAIHRNWLKWREWRERRRQTQELQREATSEINVDDETGDVADGELCVVCLMRRRRSAFVPCGHLVCCPRCAFAIEREVSPKCPVCRQSIRTSIRIYGS